MALGPMARRAPPACLRPPIRVFVHEGPLEGRRVAPAVHQIPVRVKDEHRHVPAAEDIDEVVTVDRHGRRLPEPVAMRHLEVQRLWLEDGVLGDRPERLGRRRPRGPDLGRLRLPAEVEPAHRDRLVQLLHQGLQPLGRPLDRREPGWGGDGGCGARVLLLARVDDGGQGGVVPTGHAGGRVSDLPRERQAGQLFGGV